MKFAGNLQEILEINNGTLRSIVAFTFLALEGNNFCGGTFVKKLYDILSYRGLYLKSGFIGDNQLFLVASRSQSENPEVYYLCDMPKPNFDKSGNLKGVKRSFEVINK